MTSRINFMGTCILIEIKISQKKRQDGAPVFSNINLTISLSKIRARGQSGFLRKGS